MQRALTKWLVVLILSSAYGTLVADDDGITFIINKTFRGNFGFAHNRYNAPVQVQFNHPIISEQRYSIVLEPTSTTQIPLEKELPRDLQRTWRFGRPLTTISATTLALPFKRRSGVISQGVGGSVSHQDLANYHAIDIGLKKDTPILAAKPGTVFVVVDHFTQSGLNPTLKTRANEIRILHEDGTFATYAHIAPASAKVKVGDVVETGQELAKSGDIGFVAGPHLHFVVQKNNGTSYQSVPFILMNGGVPVSLTRGTELKPPKRTWWHSLNR